MLNSMVKTKNTGETEHFPMGVQVGSCCLRPSTHARWLYHSSLVHYKLGTLPWGISLLEGNQGHLIKFMAGLL